MAPFMNGGTVVAAAVFVTCTLATPCVALGQQVEIGIIDLYALGRVPARQVREILTFTEGGHRRARKRRRAGVSCRSRRTAWRGRRTSLALGPRSSAADQGRAIVYVGIEERGVATMRFRAEPEGDARLAADVVRAGDEAGNAIRLAVLRGDSGEDWSRGHALGPTTPRRALFRNGSSCTRTRDLPELRLVLQRSSDAAPSSVGRAGPRLCN